MNRVLAWLEARARARTITEHACMNYEDRRPEALLAHDNTHIDPALTEGARLQLLHRADHGWEAYVPGAGLVIYVRADQLVRLDEDWPYDHTVGGL